VVEVNNGVVVRGLRVLRSNEYRGMSWWKTLLAIPFQAEAGEEYWSVLTVRDANGHQVALRRFETIKAADIAREEFVTRVNSLCDSDFEAADWQWVLDHS
jgi:hypothetical protein